MLATVASAFSIASGIGSIVGTQSGMRTAKITFKNYTKVLLY
jgi:hypothetical protein